MINPPTKFGVHSETGVFPSLDCVSNSLPVTLRDFWRLLFSRAAAHSDCCFFAPCTNILTYSLWSKREGTLGPDQAGYQKSRSTCDQVAALTTHSEQGFQYQLKTGTVFLDQTAACDMVWHTGLFSETEQEHDTFVCSTHRAAHATKTFSRGR